MNLAEELGVSGGAASGDGGEGAALAEEAGEVGGFAGRGRDLRFVHRDFRFPAPANVSGEGRYVLLILNQLGGETSRKTGHVCPVCRFGPGAGFAPLIPGYDRGARNSVVRRRGVRR